MAVFRFTADQMYPVFIESKTGEHVIEVTDRELKKIKKILKEWDEIQDFIDDKMRRI